MGRIKTKLVKRVAFDLMQGHKDKLTNDFEGNKLALNEILGNPNKKLRNSIAGYVTRLMKQAE
jgi:small subunit ribosomal protein S17e